MKENKMVKRCSVCGDDCQMNVRLVWERLSDKKRFDICCLCAEEGKVNAESVNNYPSTYVDTDTNTQNEPKIAEDFYLKNFSALRKMSKRGRSKLLKDIRNGYSAIS